MRAVALHTYGQPPSVMDRPRPPLRPGSLLIRVTAAPINQLDLLCASGTSYFGRHSLPYIPGVEGVGIVSEGDALPSGTRVWLATDAGMRAVDGSMAEFCVVPQEMAHAVTADVADTQLAGLGLTAVAAHLSITKVGCLVPGEQVLVLGASGAVGRLAIQVARLRGARRVIAACRTPSGAEAALALGADAAIVLRGDPGEMTGTIQGALQGDLDLIIDALWGVPAAAGLAALRAGGRLVNFGSGAGAEISIASSFIRSRELQILGYTNARASFAEKAAVVQEMAEHLSVGRIRVQVDQVGFSKFEKAWIAQGIGTPRKQVLVPAL